MPFDIASLKDKLDAQQFADLSAFVAEQTTRAETAEGKARAATKESIDGRTKIKAENEKFKTDLALALDKLGIDSADQLADLTDAKGQAEALKQYEVQLKRAQRERDEFKASLTDMQGSVTASKREAAIAAAMASQPFLDADLARDFISARIVQEGNDFVFNAGTATEPKHMPMKDGAAWMAATKPLLMPPAGNGATGSGFKAGMGGTPPASGPGLDPAAIYASRLPQAPAAAK
jgi:hypothetical protein